MQALISSFSPLKKFKDKIKLKMIDFLTMVYTSLKYQEAKVYDFIRYLTLDQKYLIMKGVKQDLINKKNKKKNKKKKKNSQKNSKNGKRGSKKGKNQNKGQGDND